MKIKTSELIGPPLDWAVECALRGSVVDVDDFVMRSADESYSRHWDQGGPIIEREKIGLSWDETWGACHPRIRPKSKRWSGGPTPLIAAMRCYVASKLGDEVEVPDEFVTMQQEENERLTRIKAEGEQRVNEYTVILVRPDYIADDANDAVVIEHCRSDSPANAALVAQCDLAERDGVAECGGSAADYVVIGVYAGHLESLL